MSFGSIIFTDRGRLLQAKAQTGKQLNFTKIQLGDGALGGQAIQPLSALISPKKNVAITTIKIGEGTATVGGILNNSDITTGFYWREVGLFARDPDTNAEILYCYGNAGALAEYIPAGGGSEILEKRLDIIAIIGNAANVSATIDSSLVFLTPSELDGHNTSPQAHEDIRLLINNLSNPATKEALGLVKIGDNLTVDAEGRVSGPAAYTHPAAKQCNYVAPVSSVAGRTGAVTLSKGDVGLGSVENYGIATTAEAQVGTVNNKYMTPLRVKELVDSSQRISNIDTEINNLKSSVSSGKTSIASAITGKGVSASGSDTFATLANKITSIQTGQSEANIIKFMASLLRATITNGTGNYTISNSRFDQLKRYFSILYLNPPVDSNRRFYHGKGVYMVMQYSNPNSTRAFHNVNWSGHIIPSSYDSQNTDYAVVIGEHDSYPYIQMDDYRYLYRLDVSKIGNW